MRIVFGRLPKQLDRFDEFLFFERERVCQSPEIEVVSSRIIGSALGRAADFSGL
jgi:hypothetical protein